MTHKPIHNHNIDALIYWDLKKMESPLPQTGYNFNFLQQTNETLLSENKALKDKLDKIYKILESDDETYA